MHFSIDNLDTCLYTRLPTSMGRNGHGLRHARQTTDVEAPARTQRLARTNEQHPEETAHEKNRAWTSFVQISSCTRVRRSMAI